MVTSWLDGDEFLAPTAIIPTHPTPRVREPLLPRGLCVLALVAGMLASSGCINEEPPRTPTPALPAPTVARPALAAPSISPVVSPSPSPSPAAAGQTYVVGTGDTLSSVADRFYGDATLWRTIFEANRDILTGPDALQVGMRIRIPPRPT